MGAHPSTPDDGVCDHGDDSQQLHRLQDHHRGETMEAESRKVHEFISAGLDVKVWKFKVFIY